MHWKNFMSKKYASKITTFCEKVKKIYLCNQLKINQKKNSLKKVHFFG
jgi:hypothetical protein